MKNTPWYCCAAAVAVGLMAASVSARPARGRRVEHRQAAGVFYNDPSATSSAEVDQVLPNSHEVISNFTAVKRILFRRGIFVIHWGHGAVTVLPSRYVMDITVNKHRALAPAQRPKPQ